MAASTPAGYLKTLAFLQRAFGLEQRYRPLEKLDFRAARFLKRLSEPTDSFRFRLAMEQLRFNWDLLIDEAAHSDEVLALQIRLIDLARASDQARNLCKQMLTEPPMGHLVSAVIAQGHQDQAAQIEISFAPQAILVRYFVSEDWKEAMTIPTTLENSFRGILRLVEHADYAHLRPLMTRPDSLPSELDFAWQDRHLLTVALH